ncbi:MAG: hypothetical protein EXR72_07345 [Myxococcales bacterium]|nr:hypothetical protein [Myxococcales bacterium]
MVSGAALFLAAVASTTTPALDHGFSEQPLCDEDSGFEELFIDAGAPPLALAPAAGPTCAAPVVPVVIECSDPRASLWVQEMIGSCDMPRSASYGLRARPIHDHKSICRSTGCERDPIPLRAASRLDDGSSSLVARGVGTAVPPVGVRLPQHPPRRLRGTFSPRLDRPPRG